MYWEYYVMGIILLPGLIFAIYAQAKVMSAFGTYKRELTRSGITGVTFANRVIQNKNLNITINHVSGEMTDFYDSKHKTLNLSETSLNSSSIAGLGVAAHELGHAIQDDEGYKLLKIRHILITTNNICSKILWPLIVIGLILNFAMIDGVIGSIFLWSGIAFFGISMLVSLVTLPVEFNASKRALKLLQAEQVLTEDELDGAKKVLNAAALTYVASLVVSILSLLRFLLVVASSKKRD